MNPIAQTTIAALGAGNTGASFAYSLLLSGFNPRILIVDPEQKKAEEQALDLQQAMIFSHPHEVRAASMAEVARAGIIVICGVEKQKEEGASELLRRNLNLIEQAAVEIAGANPHAVLLVGAAPVDLLTYVAWKTTGLPRSQVIGAGTIAETATLRYLLGKHFRVDPQSVHAYVLGGNGGRFPVWSSATIAGMYITEVCKAHGCPPSVLQALFNQVRDRMADPEHPGAREFSAGAGLSRLAAAVLRNENHVFSISTVLQKQYGLNNVALSVPAVIGEKGIDRILRIELNDEEVAELLSCGQKIAESIDALHLTEHHAPASEVC